MFYGQYEHAIDDKGRLTIPSKLREALEKSDKGAGMLTRGLEGCIFLFGRGGWEGLQEKFQALPTLSGAKVRAFVRVFTSGACEFEIDKQGRIGVPSFLREHAGIERDVVVIGARDHVEIWSRERWDEYLARQTEVWEETAEGLMDFGI